MPTYTKILLNRRGERILPKTIATSVYMNDKRTVEDAVNEKVKKAGDTLTGNLKTNMFGSTQTPVKIYGGNSTGQGAKIGAGGTLIVGGGPNIEDLTTKLPTNDGKTYIAASNEIVFVTNLENGWDNRKEINITNEGKIDSGEGGLEGDLKGNADTATALKTKRKLKVSGCTISNPVEFDGTADVDIKVDKFNAKNFKVSGCAISDNHSFDGTKDIDINVTKLVDRTFQISGGATAAAKTYNGTGNVNLEVTALDMSKANAGTLSVARGGTGQTSLDNVTVKTAKQLDAPDVRSTNQPPSWYWTNYPLKLVAEFKTGSTIGIGTGNYDSGFVQLITMVPWSDASGGYPKQFAISSQGIFYRIGVSASGWGAWNKSSTNDHAHDASVITGVLPVAHGGTGQTNLANVSVGYATSAGSANTANSATTASTANSLATTVTIAGQSFNGTQNVTITPEGIGTNRVCTQSGAPSGVPNGTLWAW